MIQEDNTDNPIWPLHVFDLLPTTKPILIEYNTM